jgi:hypothetical protein
MDSNNIVTPFILYDPNMIDNLAHLPEMCIFGLINNDNKSILIYRTKNIVTSLSRIIKEYKYSNKKILRDFKLIIIEKIDDPNNLWIRYNFHNDQYSNKGYIVHNRCRYNIRYRLRKQILGDFRMKYDKRHLFYVKIVSRRNKEIVVGIFDNVPDMDRFTETHYPDGLILNIEYANNNITKEYRKL